MTTASRDTWFLAHVTVPQGTIHPHQREMVFHVIYGVTTIEQYRTGIVPVLKKIMEKCQVVVANSSTDPAVAAQGIIDLYGAHYPHVTGIVKGPRENIANVQAVLVAIRETLRGGEKKAVTLMFHPEMYDALLTIVAPTPANRN